MGDAELRANGEAILYVMERGPDSPRVLREREGGQVKKRSAEQPDVVCVPNFLTREDADALLVCTV